MEGPIRDPLGWERVEGTSSFQALPRPLPTRFCAAAPRLSLPHSDMRLRLPFFFALFLLAMVTTGADGCSGDPNIETAKLDLRNKEYDSALQNLNEALADNPENVEALSLKARVLATKLEAAPMAERAALIPDLQATLADATRLAPEDEDLQQIRAFSWVTLLNSGNSGAPERGHASVPVDPLLRGGDGHQPGLRGWHLRPRAGSPPLATTPLRRRRLWSAPSRSSRTTPTPTSTSRRPTSRWTAARTPSTSWTAHARWRPPMTRSGTAWSRSTSTRWRRAARPSVP